MVCLCNWRNIVKEAEYYEKIEAKHLRCTLCPNYCSIAHGKAGQCRVRENIGGKLHTTNFGETTSIGMDTIEKKPLYHFYPGRLILSISPNSCNMRCPWCQNAELSQKRCPTHFVSPEDMVRLALDNDSFGIAYTYTEPFTWYEYIKETGRLARENGLKNVLVTNGMINEKPLMEILPLIDAMNIDLKSMEEHIYKDIIKGELETVLGTIKIAKNHCHIEITNLLIPELNDSREAINKLVHFVKEIGRDTPLHFSRYFPYYKYSKAPTPSSTLLMAYRIAKEQLLYVYVGNIVIPEIPDDTYCPECGNRLIERSFISGRVVGITDGRCSKCAKEVNVVTGKGCRDRVYPCP